MRIRTLADLISDVRLRADNQALPDSVLVEFINQSISDLYDMLTSAFGDEYFEVESIVNTTPTVPTIPVPSDFYKLNGLFWQNGSYFYRIIKVQPMEAEQYLIGIGWNTFYDVRYRLQAANIHFYPTPLGTHPVKIKYVPCAVRLVASTDTFDGYNGWEEWVVLDSAAKCLEREGNDGDLALIVGRKEKQEQRIRDLADRDRNEPARVQDTNVGTPWAWRKRAY